MSDTDLEFMLVFCKCGHVRAVHDGLEGPAFYWGVGRCSECTNCSEYRSTNKKLMVSFTKEMRFKRLFNLRKFLEI